MSERFTRSAARNVFYGGSVFFFVVFVGLTAQSHWHVVTASTDTATLTDAVVRGKHVWEENACINCHSILGEGAYFAPELGNVWVRYGGRDDPARLSLDLRRRQHRHHELGPAEHQRRADRRSRRSCIGWATW